MRAELMNVVQEMRERAEFAERTGGNAIHVIAWADRIESIANAAPPVPAAWRIDPPGTMMPRQFSEHYEHAERARLRGDTVTPLYAAPTSGSAKVLVEAMEHIADEIECGCVPCTGQCRSKEDVTYELQARREMAMEALATYREGKK